MLSMTKNTVLQNANKGLTLKVLQSKQKEKNHFFSKQGEGLDWQYLLPMALREHFLEEFIR